MQKFLTAKWKDLIMANYEVDPSVLAGRVPRGTEIDLNEGKCFVSLVGFMFLETRVLGLPIPFHVNFEEVNLRFYTKRVMEDETRRAVCFVKEIVPRWAIATVICRTSERIQWFPMIGRETIAAIASASRSMRA